MKMSRSRLVQKEIALLLQETNRWLHSRSFPNRSICIMESDGDESRIAACPYHVIINIRDKENVYFSVLKKQLSLFHEVHRCGCKVFMATVALLCHSCQECLREGLEINELNDAFLNLSQFAQSVMRDVSLPCQKPIAREVKSTSRYSRHGISLSSSARGSSEITALVDNLVQKLCHRSWLRGCLAEIVSNLLTQGIAVSEWRWHLHTRFLKHCTAPGLKTFSMDGLLVSIDRSSAKRISDMKAKRMKALLITANLQSSYRHLGYEETVNVKKVVTSSQSFLDSVPAETQWRNTIREAFISVGVEVLLITGRCCPLLRIDLEADGILVIVDVPNHLIESLCERHDIESVEYPEDIDSGDLLENVELSVVENSYFNATALPYCRLSVDGCTYKTICFGHSTLNAGKIAEDEFWHEFCRVQASLQACRVLPGSGGTEEALGSRLLAESERLCPDAADDPQKLASQLLFSSVGLAYRRLADEMKMADYRTGMELQTEEQLKSQTLWDALEPRVSSFESAVNIIVTLLNVAGCIKVKYKESSPTETFASTS